MTISKKRKLWTKNEEEQLFTLYKQNLSYEEIQENYFPNCTKNSLIIKINRLIRKNLERRSRFQSSPVLNRENLVDCWFAGFFLGDGSIDSKTEKGRLNLAIKDIHLLYFIAQHFNFPIDRVRNRGKSCRLNFSKAFIFDLKKTFEISTQKSYGKVVFPAFLTIQQMKFFLLGLLYSDGNVKIIANQESKQYAVRFLQSYDFCIKLLSWIQQNTGLYLHYNENKVSKLETQQDNYD